MADMHHHTKLFFCWDGVSLAWNWDPPDFSLHILGLQKHSTVPSYWLKWSLANFLLRLALNCDPPILSLPSS
jgi:hypothetical protein